MNLQPPCSPISPSPPEAEIPSIEERVQGYVDSSTLSNMDTFSIRMLVAHLMLLCLHRQIFMELEHPQQLHLSFQHILVAVALGQSLHQ